MPLFPIPFVPLKEHALAHAALRHCRRNGECLPALVYLCGAAGVGKTAFVSTVADEPALPVVRIESTDLLRLRLERIPDDGPLASLLTECIDPALLICENIHRLKSHESPQRHLLRMIDNVLAARGVVVLTASKPPGEIGGMSPRILTRCRSGASVRLDPPDSDGRRKLIDVFCRHRRLQITQDVADLLMEELPILPRDFFAALMRLESAAAAGGAAITGEFVRANLADDGTPDRLPTVSSIIQAVAKESGVPAKAIRGESRRAMIARARRLAIFLCRDLTGASLAAIGKSFGGRSHTAVAHACRVVAAERSSRPEIEACLQRIRSRFDD